MIKYKDQCYKIHIVVDASDDGDQSSYMCLNCEEYFSPATVEDNVVDNITSKSVGFIIA